MIGSDQTTTLDKDSVVPPRKYALQMATSGLPALVGTIQSTTDVRKSESFVAPPRLKLPEPTFARTSRLVPLQRWEGFIEAVDWEAKTFTARLYDLDDIDTGDFEVAELYIDDVDEDDRELISVGAVFNWIIAYRDEKLRKRERVSSIVLRRLPNQTQQDLEDARRSGKEIADALQWK